MRLKKNIFIIDNFPIIYMGLRHIISEQENLIICGQTNKPQNIFKIFSESKPDLIILDIFINNINGIELIRNINTFYPNIPILVFSFYNERIYAEIVLRAGAKGFIMKNESKEKIILAIQKVLNGDVYLSDEISSKLIDCYLSNEPNDIKSPTEVLSDREMDILRLIGEGYMTREIATKLCIAEKTVETYRLNIKRKLRLKKGNGLIRYAFQWTQFELFGY